MSDFRFDPISGYWTAIAGHRNDRPVEFVQVEQVRKSLICPFCGGNEQETPPTETMYAADGTQVASDLDDQGNENDWWSTRVVPNKYSALGQTNAAPDREPVDEGSNNGTAAESKIAHGPYLRTAQSGRQELLIPSPRHISSVSALHDDELKVLFRAAQDRLRILRDGKIAKHGMLFMNCRCEAGATLEHIHLQLIGSPVISDHLSERVERNRANLESHNETLMTTLLRWEVEQKVRVVFEAKYLTVICPYASRFPFQIWVVPNDAATSFLDIEEDMRDELAFVTREVVRRLETVLDKPSYNLMLHMAPFEQMDSGHWYYELVPRMTRSAGFELGTDIWVNPVPPEMAAKRLRI